MRNEKLDLLVTFDKNYIEPFKVMLGYAKYCISPFLWKAKTVEVKKPIVFMNKITYQDIFWLFMNGDHSISFMELAFRCFM